MKNFEKYKDEIIKGVILRNSNCEFIHKYVLNGNCDGMNCNVCKQKVLEWFEQEYVEPYSCPLSHDEYVILKNLDARYKEIYKGKYYEIIIRGSYCMSTLACYKHLFKFIESDKKYSIQQLIADYEGEHKE